MAVGRICSRVVVTASPEESVRAGARRLADHQVGSLVIVATDGATSAIGMVTDRDIVVRCVAGYLDPDITPLAAIMTAPARSVNESTPIEEATTGTPAAIASSAASPDVSERIGWTRNRAPATSAANRSSGSRGA